MKGRMQARKEEGSEKEGREGTRRDGETKTSKRERKVDIREIKKGWRRAKGKRHAESLPASPRNLGREVTEETHFETTAAETEHRGRRETHRQGEEIKRDRASSRVFAVAAPPTKEQ